MAKKKTVKNGTISSETKINDVELCKVDKILSANEDDAKVIADYSYTMSLSKSMKNGTNNSDFIKMHVGVEIPCKKSEVSQELSKSSVLCREIIKAHIDYTRKKIRGESLESKDLVDALNLAIESVRELFSDGYELENFDDDDVEI